MAGPVVEQQAVRNARTAGEDEVGFAVTVDVGKTRAVVVRGAYRSHLWRQRAVGNAKVPGAVVEQDLGRRCGATVAAARETAGVEIDRTVPVDVGRGGRVREVRRAREVGARVHKLAARGGEDERVGIAGEGQRIQSGVGDEHVGAPVAVEIGEHDAARKEGLRDGSVEHAGRLVGEVTFTVADEHGHGLGLRIQEVDASDENVDIAVACEIGRADFLQTCWIGSECRDELRGQEAWPGSRRAGRTNHDAACGQTDADASDDGSSHTLKVVEVAGSD